METVACDLCGAADAEPVMVVSDQIYHIADQPDSFQLVRCRACGLLYLNPRPDRASIGAFYPDLDYHAFTPDQGLKATVKTYLRRREARSLLAGLSSSARVLEIGCATGELLATMRAMCGDLDVVGIEPNAAAVKVAREQYGLDVRQGMLDQADNSLGMFDLVVMKYALEHVHSPRATLTAIHDLLRPGGRAVFWVPNAASIDARLFGRLWRGLDAPRHLYIFTPGTMRGLLERAGLRLTQVSYSPVPNDWAGSAAYWLRARGLPARLSDMLGASSVVGLAAWLPISALAAALRASGRIRVTAVI